MLMLVMRLTLILVVVLLDIYSLCLEDLYRMQTTVALSSMEAEYMAASAATQEALWQARLLQQLGMRIELPNILYEDNESAIMFADHPGDH